jgi:mRNA interferase MazF
MVKQYDIYWTDLNPTQGSKYGKRRPCVVVSPDELNRSLRTVVIVPMTTVRREWPFRPQIRLADKIGEACVDQIRVIDKERLNLKAGRASEEEIRALRDVIREMFVE